MTDPAALIARVESWLANTEARNTLSDPLCRWCRYYIEGAHTEHCPVPLLREVLGVVRASLWQPIETAPQEGRFLVYAAHCGYFMVMDGKMLAMSRWPHTPQHLSGSHWTHWCRIPQEGLPRYENKAEVQAGGAAWRRRMVKVK